VKKIFYIFIFFTYFCFSFANDNHQKQIDNLFNQLKTANSYDDSKEIESKIWELWATHPSENSLTALLADGSLYMSQNKLITAYETFTKTIELDPNWAEAWNKRATVLYLMGKYEMSQADIDKVLKIEKRHFGALSGQGLVQTALKNYQKAIDSYIEAHKVHPNMKSPLIMIEKLKLQIKKESI
jgi:tetratricopeptide (TPR) repeat protein